MARNDLDIAVDAAYEDLAAIDSALGEKGLLAAVLMSAVHDLDRAGDVNRKATEFFLSKEEDYIFSFRSICQFLNIDPKRILRFAGLTERP